MRTALIFLTSLALFGCTTSTYPEKPSGALLFSTHIVQMAFADASKNKSGFEVYLGGGGVVTAYSLGRGRVVKGLAGSGVDSEHLQRELESIAFEPFDFEAEVQRVQRLLPVTVVIKDGAEYEVRFALGDIDFALRRWNLGSEIEFYAPHSPKIAKLKAVLDCFALHYGRERLTL